MLRRWRPQALHSLSPRCCSARRVRRVRRHEQTRSLLTLAIETSCDDTSVAVLEKQDEPVPAGQPRALLHFHEKVTSDNREFQGIDPIGALESHQENLAALVQKAIASYSSQHVNAFRPDFISVTRGPGMRSSVSTGIDTAKGLSVAYGVPLVGVNHMQAHALTPRLVSSLNGNGKADPAFPFLSLLVSGGHTMLLHSESLTVHKILANTCDIAIGDALDKIARLILPGHIIQACKDVSYARELESFVFPSDSDQQYTPPASRQQEVTRRETQWGWSLPVPFAETRGGQKAHDMEFTFSGLNSTVHRTIPQRLEANAMSDNERREMGYEAMRVAFEHVASRTVLGLNMLKKSHPALKQTEISTLVVSGGVAANKFMRLLFRKFLDMKGYEHVQLRFPPLEFCTDNAAMIAWAGMEMYEAGWESELSIRALRKWTLDPTATDGGILGVGGWIRRCQSTTSFVR